MKDVLQLLKETTEIEVAPAVLKGNIRELEMDELGLVSGGQKGTSIFLSASRSGGSSDDSLDGSYD